MLLLTILLLSGMRGEAKYSDRFSKEKPLTVLCDWELPPYEFLNDKGQPAGYTIEVLDAILGKLKIPYRFVLLDNPSEANNIKADQNCIFLVSTNSLPDKDCYLSSNVMYYFKIKVASRNNAPPINSIADAKPDEMFIFRLDGQIASSLLPDLHTKAKVEYHAPMEALSGVSSGKYDYFIWGEEPLKWKIKELNIENIRLNDIDIPTAEIRIGGYDKELIDAIDDQYARFDQTGDIDMLRDKWLHPERHHDNASPVVLYVAAAVIILLLLLFLLNRLVARNVKRMTLKNSEQTRLMNMALDMGGYMVSEYNPKRDSFKNLRGNMMDEQTTMSGAMGTLHKDDVKAFENKVKELQNEVSSSDLMVRRNNGTEQQPRWQYLNGNCIKERDEENHTDYLLVAKDITEEMDEQSANNEMAAKYIKAFDISLVAMSFYDKNGRLLEINERMKEVIGFNEKNQQFFWETCLFDAPLFCDILYYGMCEVTHACQHMYYPEINLDKYLEYRVRPVFSDDGEIRYYAITVRDITAERNLYREQLLTERQLKVTSDEANKFEAQMNYLLENCNMFIWRSNYQTNTIEVSRSLHHVDKLIRFEDYLNLLSEEDRRESNNTLVNPLARNRAVNYVRHFRQSPLSNVEAWFAISGTPVYDKNGTSKGHFGVIRDVTQLMRSQEELRKETEQAEHSGAMKAAFLANMTHEIRTPLNAIVGFSDLLHMTDSPDERREFIHIIQHNCDLLLRLIDDILETSNMSERPQRIEPVDTDFPAFFDEVCQTVAQRVQNPDISFIKDNPCKELPSRTDKERIQQVITNFFTNAVKYTKEGHIKVGYRNETRKVNGNDTEGIYLYCEDTGAGIPKEKQASVFDRFVKLNDYVQGTGLGLSISKSIAERCGGQIGVESEGEGKGSTFWLWIPRFLTSSNLTAEK